MRAFGPIRVRLNEGAAIVVEAVAPELDVAVAGGGRRARAHYEHAHRARVMNVAVCDLDVVRILDANPVA
jgi:hypothetical protein